MGEVELYRADNGVGVYRRGKEYGDRLEGVTIEPTERWIRAKIGDTYLLNSKRALLQWESGIPTSNYLFPEGDVRTDLFQETGHPRERVRALASQYYDVEVDGTTYEKLAWRYDEGPLAGYIGIDWFGRKESGVEHWYEEEEEVFVHPRDPHKSVDAIASSRHVEVFIEGRKYADTTRAVLVYETWLPVRYYVPTQDVDLAALEATELLTRCPYKGIASYWSVPGVEQGKNIVWAYADPLPGVAAIKDHIAFYNEVVDIVVDGERLERPFTHFVARIVNDAPDTTGV